MRVKEKKTGKTWFFDSSDEARERLGKIGARRAEDKGSLYVFPDFTFYPDVSDDISNAPLVCVEHLRDEIVKQACRDWMKAYKSKKKEVRLDNRTISFDAMTEYFYSREFAQICTIDPDALIEMMKEEVDKES